MYNEVMDEGITNASSCDIACSDMDRVGYDFDMSGIISNENAIYNKIVDRSWVNVQQNCPISIDGNIISLFGESAVWPLGCVAPISKEALFGKSTSGSRAHQLANYSVYLCILEFSPVLASNTNLKHPQRSFLIIMVIISIIAASNIQIVWTSADIVERVELDSTSHRSNSERLPIDSVVELEDSAEIILLVEWSGEDGKMSEIDACSPPYAVHLACDEG